MTNPAPDLIRILDDEDATIDLLVEEFDRIARREGYVKLDGIDVEALKGALFTKLHVASTSDIAVVWNAAHSLLVAAGGCGDCTQCLDQEDTP